MRKLILKMSMSLDAFVAGAKGELDWIFQTTDDRSTAWTVDTISKAGLHIMGSKTFNDMAGYWPTSTEPFAPPMNDIPKAVFTRGGFTGADLSKITPSVKDAIKNREAKGFKVATTPSGADSWAHPRIFSGDLAGSIRQLKSESGKDIVAHGGAGFCQSLVATGLIDEYHLMVHPVAIGKGLPLFAALPRPLKLRLVEIKSFPAGSAAHIYKSA